MENPAPDPFDTGIRLWRRSRRVSPRRSRCRLEVEERNSEREKRGIEEGTRHEEKKGRERERERIEKGGESVNVAVQIPRRTGDQPRISRLIPSGDLSNPF